MEINYQLLADSMKKCSEDCIFRNPEIEPLVPACVEVPVRIMFVGENPSWAVGQDVPFADGTISGQALEQHYLKPLGLSRNQVWITDIIKCRYPKHIYLAKPKYEADIQNVAKTCSNLWLTKEIQLAQPYLVATLSDAQVYNRFRRAFALDIPADFSEAVGHPHEVVIRGHKTTLFPMIHPDVSRPVGVGDNRKKKTREKWSPKHLNEHIPALRKILSL